MQIQHCQVPAHLAGNESGVLVSSPSYDSPDAVHYLITAAGLKSKYSKPPLHKCEVCVGLSQSPKRFAIVEPSGISPDGKLGNSSIEVFKIEFADN